MKKKWWKIYPFFLQRKQQEAKEKPRSIKAFLIGIFPWKRCKQNMAREGEIDLFHNNFCHSNCRCNPIKCAYIPRQVRSPCIEVSHTSLYISCIAIFTCPILSTKVGNWEIKSGGKNQEPLECTQFEIGKSETQTIVLESTKEKLMSPSQLSFQKWTWDSLPWIQRQLELP